jgi:hypothetical protein
MNFPLPDWLFNWHILLIVVGLFIGLRHGFRSGGWLIMIAVGGFFLVKDYYPGTHIDRFIWPGVLILVGLMIILRPNKAFRNRYHGEWRGDWDKHRWTPPIGGPQNSAFGSQKQGYSSEDFIDATAVFGGVHKNILSRNFRGGDITTFMGGAEIDLSQADINGIVRLDLTIFFGGTKIIVPPHWEVRSEVTAVFAGFEDKRQQPAIINPEKVLVIDGTCIFGGIDLKNY